MEGPQTVTCDEELGIANACDFAQSLENVLTSENEITVDLSNTQRIDTSIAQLICLYDREAKNKGLSLNWRYSDVVLQTMETLGLENIFHGSETSVSGDDGSAETDQKKNIESSMLFVLENDN